jgi:hypothetical protein
MSASGDDGPSIPGFVWALEPLAGVVDLLVDFASDPRRFILGAVLTTLLESIFGVVSQLVDIVLLVFGGSRPGIFNAPGETLGLADLPVAIATEIGFAAGSLGGLILASIRTLNRGIFEAAGAAGPLSPIVVSAIIVAEVVFVLVLFRRVVYIVADLLQLGGLTE